MKLRFHSQLVFMIILLISPLQIQAEDPLVPSVISISGSIQDNYANISYAILFDNSNSDRTRSVIYRQNIPSGLYLSNVSATMGNLTFWGKVELYETAEKIYNDSVSSDKSAILVTSTAEYYQFDVNVKAGQILDITAYFEGYLTRVRGDYHLDLFSNLNLDYEIDFSVDIQIQSSFSSVLATRIKGLEGEQREEIKNGYRILYSDTEYMVNDYVSLIYSISTIENGGKIITSTNGVDNFFIYLLAPEIKFIEDREPREFIFVIDVSGSMIGDKIAQAKDAFSIMIGTLADDDLFNVISFDHLVYSLWNEPRNGFSENINIATDWVFDLEAGGSTNLDGGIQKALDNLDNTTSTAKVLSLLSDGRATYGETNSESIRQNTIKENDIDAMIFTIAFGDDADEELMAALAYDSNGNFIKIIPGEDAINQLVDYYETFATPVAIDYNISIDGGYDIAPDPSSLGGALFNGSEIIIAGKYGSSLEVNTSITFSSGETDNWSNNVIGTENGGSHIERIWAINTINQLLKIVEANGRSKELDDKIINLALYYGIVVPEYTALIIVIEDSDDELVDTQIDFLTEPQFLGEPPVNELQGGFMDFPIMSIFTFLMIVPIIVNRRKER